MKIFLTEIEDVASDKIFVGPYIKAQSFEEAQEIANDHDLVLVGELHELITFKKPIKETIH